MNFPFFKEVLLFVLYRSFTIPPSKLSIFHAISGMKRLDLFSGVYLKNNLKNDGFVKRPSVVLRCIRRPCGGRISTPQSLGFARLAWGAFDFAIQFVGFMISRKLE
ncbi:MAG: hypothetical protein JRI76_05560 [Deltaproteobacteria bacterium]|nr:hypothetical protein [Deltaproteobacteria bacterium]MBW1954415.1 hypothetical protein [Deltaproteobacteria bacterium]MBW2041485.1 hypothetical protein [Deltaproteobacteria bacterium]MBW2131624.1 hypothetical protein [Deltaproteobacteria bacterium]